jgi:pimeloyl-ACP methyl ester carboxylesterase
MYYEIHGDGFPLVMIHGLGGSLDVWPRSVLEELSKSFKTVIFDNRGAGRTDKPDIKYTIKMFADDTVGLMDILKIEQAHVLGHSMGGQIALGLVINYPERVEKLVLCSTIYSVPPSTEVLRIFMGDIEGLTYEEILRKMSPVLYTEEFIKSNTELIEVVTQRLIKVPTPTYSLKRQLVANGSINNRRIKKIKSPTLLMHGKKDVLCPPQNSEILAKLIPVANLALFDNNAHMLFVEEPEKFVKPILEFLK